MNRSSLIRERPPAKRRGVAGPAVGCSQGDTTTSHVARPHWGGNVRQDGPRVSAMDTIRQFPYSTSVGGQAPSIATGGEATDAYRLGDRLHAGSTGDVYEAEHPWLPGRYAIKILHPALTQNEAAGEIFRDELAAIAGLRHPNIAKIIGVGTAPEGRLFVVMELLGGRTLAGGLADGKPLPVAEVLSLVKS